ncbi:hypothetical protein [Shewanella denitrificans]|jgi:hypothetical protein|nr:hypothetical protein [Shewanella denitrificans]
MKNQNVKISGKFENGKLQMCQVGSKGSVKADRGFVAVNAPFKPNTSK